MPPVLVSLVPVAILVAMLAFCVFTFGRDTLSGASQLSLLASSGVAAAIGVWRCRLKWEYLERSFVDSVSEVMPSVLILLAIGILSGAWMGSGTVPGFIYYGIQIIHPKFFLATACIVCSVVSLMTGSSWTTIATIGLALIGIEGAQKSVEKVAYCRMEDWRHKKQKRQNSHVVGGGRVLGYEKGLSSAMR